MTKPNRVKNTSDDFLSKQIEQLREVFPQAFSEGKLDFEKLKESLGKISDDLPERYSFSWAGKRDAIRLLQTPTRATLTPCPEESVDWDNTRNLFIEGDNLEALKLLLKSYYGRVKVIYIDPPYNTGNDFIYPDNYADPLGTYLQLTGQKDTEGNLQISNPETSGRYHSAWLSMMYPRLFLARQLLSDDGVIYVSIDDHEFQSLRMIMNELFGEENHLGTIVWKKKHAYGRGDKFIIPQTEYVICYARDVKNVKDFGLPYSEERVKEFQYKDERGQYRLLRLWHTAPKGGYERPTLQYEVYTPDGHKVDSVTGQWLWSQSRMEEEILENNVVFIKQSNNTYRAFKKDYLQDDRTEKPTSLFDKATTDDATKEFNSIMPEVAQALFTKPTALLKYLIQSVNSGNEKNIVLDFFCGSGTTAQAVLELNKNHANYQFIMVQLQEVTGNPKFHTIAEISKERIRRVIAQLKKAENVPEDLGFRVYKLAESNLRGWEGLEQADEETYFKQMEIFNDPLIEGWKPENIIAEVALKEAGFGLNYRQEVIEAVTDQKVARVTDQEREQHFYICLDNRIELGNLNGLELTKDDLFICRASALDDDTAANLALQCRLKVL